MSIRFREQGRKALEMNMQYPKYATPQMFSRLARLDSGLPMRWDANLAEARTDPRVMSGRIFVVQQRKIVLRLCATNVNVVRYRKGLGELPGNKRRGDTGALHYGARPAAHACGDCPRESSRTVGH